MNSKFLVSHSKSNISLDHDTGNKVLRPFLLKLKSKLNFHYHLMWKQAQN